MNPPPAKGKARRKPCTEKPSARFDEEREVGRPLFYSTVRNSVNSVQKKLCKFKQISIIR
jgi:hypothetical protein